MTTTCAPLPLTALTPEHARAIARTATGATVVIAVAAAALSYHGLHVLAVRAGVPDWLGWLLPVAVDGLVVAGLAGSLYATLAGLPTRYPAVLVLLGVAASVAGNLLAAAPTTAGRTVAVLPPLTLALAVHQALLVLKHRAGLPPAKPRRHRTPPQSAVTATPLPSAAAEPTRAAAPRARTSRTATATAGAGTRDQVARMLAAEPGLTGAEVGRRLGVDASWARALVRQVRTAQQDQPGPTEPAASAA